MSAPTPLFPPGRRGDRTLRDADEIDMEAIASAVQTAGFHAYVEQTGGGTATIYAGRLHDRETDDPHYSAVAGPGWFRGPGWTAPRASRDDFSVGRHDHGETDPTLVSEPGAWKSDAELVAAIVALCPSGHRGGGIVTAPTPLFPLGQVVATPGALAVVEEHGLDPNDLLTRHASGDWGDLCEEDKQANEDALFTGARLFSAYGDGATRLWVITDGVTDAAAEPGDRPCTTILRPEDY